MNYTVVWLSVAENELAAVWSASSRRGDVSAAAALLDHKLAANPSTEGESRDGNRRIGFVPPLGIVFTVYENSKTVVVTRVWEYH